jgi:hypothetical protein
VHIALSLRASDSPEQELNFHGFVRELHLARFGAAQHSSGEQGRQIGVHGLDVSADTARCSANGDWACAAQGLEQLLSLGCQDLPQKLWTGEGDPVCLRSLARIPRLGEARHRLGRRTNIKRHCLHVGSFRCLAGRRPGAFLLRQRRIEILSLASADDHRCQTRCHTSERTHL